MDEIDKRLGEAGERWRASQPLPPPIDPGSLTAATGNGAGGVLVSLAAGLAGAAIVLATAGLAAQFGIWPGAASPDVGATSSDAGASAPDRCSVTRPDPAFVPPAPYPEVAPPLYESDWFGSAELWTMIDRDGEVWNHFPRGPDGLSEKTFWWTTDWAVPSDGPESGITVVGTRLDGPGTFTSGPGTNAHRDDFGEAMLVGVEIPTPGCWQITATYGDAVLSYVVWVTYD